MADTEALLADAVGARNVLAGTEIPPEYAGDESLTAVRQTPAYLVRPAATAEVADVLRIAGEAGIPDLERGAGLPAVERLGYLPESASAQLRGLRHLVLVGARSPVSFFAYPETPGLLAPRDCHVHSLAAPGDDAADALAQLAALLPRATATTAARARPELPAGELTGETVAAAVGALLPEGAIVVDEANTSGLWLPTATAGAPPHDWLTLTGGAIGQGLPLAVGAAIACPGRPVVCLEADGSSMYTLQALWTMAREGLDVTTVVYANQSYSVLEMEYERLIAAPAGPGNRQARRDLLDLSRPDLDFTGLARGMGVPASRAATAEDFAAQLAKALTEPGPHLIEARVPPLFAPAEGR
ncbi:acetolactate synthase large subunit [Streptomyces sp. NPDC086549]|uniref:acetolactate synthase large subunit n=1 Tax=Streptomyces sp. NPDC086549 TaxID=3365752 RepID=UPI0037FFBAFB